MNKGLKIPENKSVKGLFVYCNYCKSIVTTKCKKTHGSISFCPHADRHTYKAVFYIPGTKRTRTRIISTRDINEAIIETLEFEKHLKASNYENVKDNISKTKLVLLIDYMNFYLDYLNNINVPEHKWKSRSVGHIMDVERTFRYFITSLKNQSYSIQDLKVFEVGDIHVGLFHSYLINEKGYANVSYNKAISIMKSFFSFLSNNSEYLFKNPFNGISRRPEIRTIKTITQREFESLLAIIDKKRSLQILSTGEKKYHYYEWLKFGIQLGLYTGRRRDELIALKYSDIKTNEVGELLYIESEDFKVTRSKFSNPVKGLKKIYIPITRKLKAVIVENGYWDFRESDNYLLAPGKINNRETLMNQLSKGFSHYYKQLNTGRNLTFKSLRKTYISHLTASFGYNVKAITGHSGEDVIYKHYLDRTLMMKAVSEFDVFD